MAKPRKAFLLRSLVLSAIPALWCVVHFLGGLTFLENKTIDWRFRARGEIPSPLPVAYVDVDSDTLLHYKWPMNAARFADTLDALFEHGKVKAVGFDFVFSKRSLPEFGTAELHAGRVKLGQSIQRHQNVVLAAHYVPGAGVMAEERAFPYVFEGATNPQNNDLPEAADYPVALGNTLSGLITTYNGETRAAPFFAETAYATFYPLALQLALLHWDLDATAIHRFPDRMEIRRPNGEVVCRIPLLRGQLVEVNWFSPWLSSQNPRCSMVDIGRYLEAMRSEDPAHRKFAEEAFAQFHGKIVLIGPVDVLLQDINSTSMDDGPVPQVGFHGNMLKTLVSGRFLRHAPAWAEALLILVLSAAVGALAVKGGGRSVGNKIAAGLILAVFVGVCFWVFGAYDLVLPLVTPFGAAFTTSFAAVGWRLIEEERQKGRIKGMFGTYVSPELVNRMVESGEDPKLGGAEVEVTAYFSDIENFSAFSEQMTPPRLVELMNEYLTVATDTITAERGTLDKYVGDAVVAMFGAPVAQVDHAYRACIASLLVQQRLADLRRKWQTESAKWPEAVAHMHTRIGLNSGLAIVGNMGSLTRFNYTMMGDNVNLGARMESGARTYGVSTMVTEATKAAAEKHGDRCVFRFLDRIVVKGRSAPVSIYELVGLKGELPASSLDGLALFSAAMEKYFQQDWSAAAALFQRAAELERFQTVGADKTNPSLLYRKRCELMRLNPPPRDWDGVYVMRTK